MLTQLLLLLAFALPGQANRQAPSAASCSRDYQLGDLWLEQHGDVEIFWECLISGWEDTVDASGGGGGAGDVESVGSCLTGACFSGEEVVTDATAANGDLGGFYPNPSVDDDSHAHSASTISGLDAGDTITGSFADARVDGSLEADEVGIGGDGSGTAAALVVTDDSHSHGASTISGLDTGDTTTGTWADARVASSNVTQHEAALESVLDLQDMQGAVTDAQVSNAITVDGGTIDLPGSTVSDIVDDQVFVGSGAGAGGFKTLPDCTTGKLLYTQSTNTVSCGTDAVGVGGSGSGEYNPDNYSPAGDTLLSDEFTAGAVLAWTARNLDSAVISYALGGAFISNAGTTDAWHGQTTTVPADSGADWFLVTRVSSWDHLSTTTGCGISIITGGTAAVPTEINSVYYRATSGTVAAIEHHDHDDYDYAGPNNFGTNAFANSNEDLIRTLTGSIYLMLQWIDATEDIQAYWSWNGMIWRPMTTDTTVDGYPVAIGMFARDNNACFFEFFRVLDTDIDSAGSPLYRIGQ